MLFGTLRECNSVVSYLNLYDNEIDDKCMKQLGEYVQDNQHLEILWLESNYEMTDEGIEIISEYLIGNTKLKELSLRNNKGITDKSVPLLLKIFDSSYIENMGIHDTSITQKDIFYVPLICNRIKNDLTRLDLRRE